MWKVLVALSALTSLHLAVLGSPVELDDPSLDDVDFNATGLEGNLSINQVSAISLSSQATSEKYSVPVLTRVSWLQAQHHCSSQGLNLASINSMSESAQIIQYLYENGLSYDEFWTSGNSLVNGERWTWMSTGRLFSYKNWNSYNHYSGCQCLLISSNGDWIPSNCSSEHYFICESRCALSSYDVPIYPPAGK